MSFQSDRDILLAHSRSKKNGRFPVTADIEGRLTNPICGDHVELKIVAEKERIVDIGFRTSACAICSASASLLCESIVGHAFDDVHRLADAFEREICILSESEWPKELEPYRCFLHLRKNPSRRMCALLPWIALKSATKDQLNWEMETT